MSRSKKVVEITFATATTPAMSKVGTTDKERMHLSPAEFAAQLKNSGQEVKDLVKIARKVGALKSGQQLRLADGSLMGAKELNTLVSTHVKTLKQLKKNYVARGSKKKRSPLTKEGKVRKQGKGFGQASFLEAPLVNFLRTANFGMVPGTNQPLRDVLAPLLEVNILSRAVLTPLLTIYEFVNGLRFEDAEGNKFFRAGPEMVQNLGPYLSALEASDRALTDAQLVDKNGKPKLRFDRNKFVYNRLQSIVKPGIRSQAALSDEEKAYLAQPQLEQLLAEVQAVVSAANHAVNPPKK